ncbi:DUF3592 domain-containing protein [Abyssisolibacter fermentans]|uniref:DUF3592 domain-containing protein n=1 Tax=Abyssisolibacter fermentans TaxID=1766203 RepID=UPI000834986D|nr:DUF3592 domain-containing protein [Abyssisolibacter fermentans]
MNLSNELLFFMVMGMVSLTYAIYQISSFYRNKDKIEYTTATIIETTTVVPEAMKKNNSRWASVSLVVDGKEYISSKRIQVSMNTSVGDQIKVAYFNDNPSEIFTPSLKKGVVFLVIGVACLLINIYLKSKY